jgi:catechol 2,3-dioxygenase-like lactoylglutathione lyase family enzyme
VTSKKYDVGGVLLDRPFKVRRLGHFGYNVEDVAACLDFYCELLGFRISDPQDLAAHHPKGADLKGLGDTHLYFLRHGTDHHSFVMFNRRVFNALGRAAGLPPDVDVNQMTWQVGSLSEVVSAIDYFAERKVRINRAGRDMPGSNWHVYPYDPEGHRNELYYGIEQIGWFGAPKPRAAHERGFQERPQLPQIPEYEEVGRMMAKGVDLASGHRHPERAPATFDVDGILLPRPFKVVRHGPIRLFCRDLDAMARFYCDVLGFLVTDDFTWEGHRCVFLRCNTEHHSLALYPMALRAALGWPEASTVLSFGMQVANYRQLRSAVAFLEERGCRLVEIPGELTPGTDYRAFALDPAGHGVELYYYMEQVGWDGRPRPRRAARHAPVGEWPQTVEPVSDTYMGEPYLGPWG